MVTELIWSSQARKDLLDIYIIIGSDNPVAAERLYDAIEAKAEALSHYPRLGQRRPDIRAAMRMLVEGPYHIRFETHPDTNEGPVDRVEIVRVVDGRRPDRPILAAVSNTNEMRPTWVGWPSSGLDVLTLPPRGGEDTSKHRRSV